MIRNCGVAAAFLLAALPAVAQTVTWNFSALYNGGALADPNPIVIGPGNVIYGTIGDGVTAGGAYSLTPPASPGGAWIYAWLLDFNDGDGTAPETGLTVGGNGVLYGTAVKGGGGTRPRYHGCGTVYALIPPPESGGTWTQVALYRFADNGCTRPSTPVVLGAGSVLYGCAGNVVYSLTPSTTVPWKLAVLYTFTGGSDGGGPSALTLGSGGALYGATSSGGIGYGTAFSLTPPSSSGESWSLNVLHSFEGGAGGEGPSSLTIGPNGVLYGVMNSAGLLNSACLTEHTTGCGTVFALTPPQTEGEPWTLSTIYSFTGGNDGWSPKGPLLYAPGGNLIGAAYLGPGEFGDGTIYSLAPPDTQGGAWTETTLYGLAYPNAGPENIVFGKNGALYGVSYEGGACEFELCGVVFSLVPQAGGPQVDAAYW